MDELVELDSCRKGARVTVSAMLTTYPSPLQWQDWEDCLANHPVRRFAAYITNGIREGFLIGYDYQSDKCKKATGNMYSAADHLEVIREYIANECSEGHILGPFDPNLLPEVQISRFGVIPKRNSSSWRLILDLSSPEGWSVNNGIDSDLCSLSYVSIEDTARAIVGVWARIKAGKN